MADETKLPDVQENKKPWLSKTLWLNALMAAAAFIPPAKDWMASHMDLVLMGFSALNMALRLVSKDKISLQD
jgi:hypothetical protein